MKKTTLKTKEVINAYKVLNGLKLAKLDNDEVLALLHVKRTMRPIVKAYEEYVEDSRKAVLPGNIEEISRKMQAKEPLTADESAIITEADKRLGELLIAELDKEHEIMLDRLTETTLVKLVKDCELETKDEDLIYFLFE